MPKRFNSDPLETKIISISKKDYERILMWSMSEKEIRFICLGTGKSVKKVVRLCNIAQNPKNYCLSSSNHQNWSGFSHTLSQHKILAHGHSHPSKHHNQHPSATDIKFSEEGKIELIAFPHSGIVRGWILRRSVKQTKESEIKIQIRA